MPNDTLDRTYSNLSSSKHVPTQKANRKLIAENKSAKNQTSNTGRHTIVASIASSKNGHRRILFYDQDRSRKTLHLGKCSIALARKVQGRLESVLSAKLLGGPVPQDDANWLANEGIALKPKFESLGLIPPSTVKLLDNSTVESQLSDFILRVGKTKKPGTIAVWEQVKRNLLAFLPTGIKLADVTKGHAKQFHDHLRQRKLASLTIQKHVRISRQMFEDAVEWEKIAINPFSKVRVSTGSAKSNVDVPREIIDKVMKHCDLTWNVIIALSRFGGLRTPSETLSIKWADIDWENNRMKLPEPKVEHHEGRGVRICPLFPELRTVLEKARAVAEKDEEYIVNKPAYREAANTGTGWKNSNLRTQFVKILKRAKVTPWSRLFHSMRASRQTELEREFPLHVVCAWLGNSPKIAQRSYLLVTEQDFINAAKPKASMPGMDNGRQPDTAKNRGTKTTRAAQKQGTKATPQGIANRTQNVANTQGKHGRNHDSPENSWVKLADGEGFEPTDAFRRLRFSRPVQ
jgi:integrase